MEINYKNTTYVCIERFNKYSISMKKMYADLKMAEETNNYCLEGYIKRALGIIQYIRNIQEEQKIKILNYYCQGSAEYSFIEALDGTKYVYQHRNKKLIKDSSWN